MIAQEVLGSRPSRLYARCPRGESVCPPQRPSPSPLADLSLYAQSYCCASSAVIRLYDFAEAREPVTLWVRLGKSSSEDWSLAFLSAHRRITGNMK